MWLQLLHDNFYNYSLLCKKCDNIECGCDVDGWIKGWRKNICTPDHEFIKKNFGFDVWRNYV